MHSLKERYPSEFCSFEAMRSRCNSRKNKNYRYYGGRGIKVHPGWLGRGGFARFMRDIGPKPDASYTIDREDVDGDYCPDNCRWATRAEQAFNRRCSKIVEVNGEKMTLHAAALLLGVPVMTYWHRVMEYGIAPVDAARAPRRRNARLITYEGRTQTIPEWASELGVRPGLIWNRLLRGLPIEQVLTPGLLR